MRGFLLCYGKIKSMKKLLFAFYCLLLLPSCGKEISLSDVSLDKEQLKSYCASSSLSSSSLPFSFEGKKAQKTDGYLYTVNCFDFRKERKQVRWRITPDNGSNVFFMGYDSPYTLLSSGESNKARREVKAMGIHFSSPRQVDFCKARLKSQEGTYFFDCERKD